MEILLKIIFLYSFVFANGMKRTGSNEFELESGHGHKFKIEIDYIESKNKSDGNTCIAQYMITNIGAKDYIREEKFAAGEKIINGTKLPVEEFDPSLIFEFSTIDGKKIEVSETMLDNILVGKTTQARKVRAEVGFKTCSSEIKPIRIQYRKTLN
ncbi:MAG: hypothetical protein J0L54_08575 [Chitinophagales bacterium]|nr:hypothetical protein [Chitinophagales bacterium]